MLTLVLPRSLSKNEYSRRFWLNYCKDNADVEKATLLDFLVQYMQNDLQMETLDVQQILSEQNKVALGAALDADDGNGKVKHVANVD